MMNLGINALTLALIGLSTSGLPGTLSAGEDSAPQIETFESYLDVGYNQTYRPQFHFTSRKNPLNDPNGMVYYDGEYHLFFQHNPSINKVRCKIWGHAVSKDMVHWEQLPHAILPYDGGLIFSGTGAVDHNNTLGRQKGDVKTLLACFSFAKEPFYQALAYSTDKGRTFELLNEGKAIVPNQGFDPAERDPKLFWHEPTKKWVMILWVQRAITDKHRRGNRAKRYRNVPNRPGKVRFFTSDNLTDWEVASDFDRDWAYECMDFVHLPVDGDPNNKKWLLFDASFDYGIGDFDGKTFTTDEQVGLGDFGPNYYAAQTFNNSPDGRTVVIGWMMRSDFEQVGMPFNQQMSFPSTMELRTTPEGIKLFRWPIREIESLYTKKHAFTNRPLQELATELGGIEAELIDASIEFDPKETGDLEWTLRGLTVSYHADKQQFSYKADPQVVLAANQDKKRTIPTTRLSAPAVDGKVKLRVLVDRGSIELFANEGAAVATHFALPEPANRSITLSGKGCVSLVINELKSSWTPERPDAGDGR
jgi:fructan beta-fructosidase